MEYYTYCMYSTLTQKADAVHSIFQLQGATNNYTRSKLGNCYDRTLERDRNDHDERERVAEITVWILVRPVTSFASFTSRVFTLTLILLYEYEYPSLSLFIHPRAEVLCNTKAKHSSMPLYSRCGLSPRFRYTTGNTSGAADHSQSLVLRYAMTKPRSGLVRMRERDTCTCTLY